MAWQTPKTDWAVNPKNPVPEDFNRIEGNIDFLKSDIETKKGAIVNALNTVGLETQLTDTHAQIASKITAANQGTKIYTPGTANITIPKGFHSGQGYVKGDANLKAENIGKGRTIFGVNGTFEGYYTAGNSLLIETTSIHADSDTYTKVSEIRVLFSGSIRYYFYATKSGWISGAVYRAQIRINGVPVGTERQGSTDKEFTEDINVNQGDLIQLYMRISQPESQFKSRVRANPIRILVDKAIKVDILL